VNYGNAVSKDPQARIPKTQHKPWKFRASNKSG